MYGRSRENIFGEPSSVSVLSKSHNNSLNIKAPLILNRNSSSDDINSILIELFNNDQLSEICKSKNEEKFIKFLFEKGVLKAAAEDAGADSKGWLVANAYVAGNSVAIVALQVIAAVGAVVMAIAVRKPQEEEKATAYIKEVRNPILNTCRTIARKLGGDDFGSQIHNLFYGLESGEYQIVVKDSECIVDFAR